MQNLYPYFAFHLKRELNNKEAIIRYLNNSHNIMKLLWSAIDEYLKEEVERQMEPFIGTWRWIDWRQVSAQTINKLKTYKEGGDTAYDNILKNVRMNAYFSDRKASARLSG